MIKVLRLMLLGLSLVLLGMGLSLLIYDKFLRCENPYAWYINFSYGMYVVYMLLALAQKKE